MCCRGSRAICHWIVVKLDDVSTTDVGRIVRCRKVVRSGMLRPGEVRVVLRENREVM